MKESNMARADFITSIVLIAFGIGVLAMSVQMPGYASRGASPYSAPGLVPGFLGGIIALFGVILCVRSVRRQGYKLGITAESTKHFLTSVETVRLVITMLVSVLYAIVLLGRVLYPLATGIYVLVFVLLFEYKLKVPFAKQWKVLLFAVILAVLTAGLVTAVFQYLFLVELPG
ncbi:MAG TPA: tripartite tricarboxylate transporter TctB family protein [Spirochaetia bacterium]|nr:tripartite tricarboxylate transporter TctB family protein [Spirochaetia bacterium]HUZ18300.1 tripartite tricarboxylate transporter TctB family protein [Spirochaetia bacterium]